MAIRMVPFPSKSDDAPPPATEKWFCNTDEEHGWGAGPYDSRDDAIDDAPDVLGLEAGDTFYTGREIKIQWKDDPCLSAYVIEDFGERLGLPDDWDDRFEDGEKEDLNRFLNEAVAEWFDDRDLGGVIVDISDHTAWGAGIPLREVEE